MVPKTRLVASDLTLSRLGLGLSKLHHLPHASARRRLVDAALDLGVSHFDAARLYGDGLAERALGEALAGRRAAATIATKFGLLPNRLIERLPVLGLPLGVVRAALRRAGLETVPRRCWTAATLEHSLAASLRALRTDYVDVLLLHDPRPDELATADELLRALERVKASGRARLVGLATAHGYARAILAQAADVFDIVQVPERTWDGGSPVPDITHGALAEGPQTWGAPGIEPSVATQRLRQALARRPRGVVLVGTCREEHLRQLALAAAEDR